MPSFLAVPSRHPRRWYPLHGVLRCAVTAALLSFGSAEAALGQRAEALRLADFADAGPGAQPVAAEAAAFERYAVEAAREDPGDLRLMLIGGAAGGALGYVTGWAMASGVASVAEAAGSQVEPQLSYLRALPALASALGTSTGATRFSCTRFRFGSVYPLNSCAQSVATLAGALPGAVALYFVPAGNVGAIAGAVAAEALGAALAGMLSRRPSSPEPEF